jgi:hypothetical protein
MEDRCVRPFLQHSISPILQSSVAYPWRCLCLGLGQITRTRPLRMMILHLSHIFLMDARIFIMPSFASWPCAARRPAASLEAVGDPSARQVIRRQFNFYLVTRQNADEVLAHLPGDVSENHVFLAFEPHAKHGVGQGFQHSANDFNRFFFCHSPQPIPNGVRRGRGIQSIRVLGVPRVTVNCPVMKESQAPSR